MRLASARSPRAGLSLMEVLVATTIFLLSFVAISSLIDFGIDQARRIEWETDASRLAESKISEVVAGVEPLSSQSNVPFEYEPEWSWSLEAIPDDLIPNLWTVSVTVSRMQRNGEVFEATITRMVIDPAMRGQLAPSPEEEEMLEEPIEGEQP